MRNDGRCQSGCEEAYRPSQLSGDLDFGVFAGFSVGTPLLPACCDGNLPEGTVSMLAFSNCPENGLSYSRSAAPNNKSDLLCGKPSSLSSRAMK